MTDFNELDQQIAQKLAAHKEDCLKRYNRAAERMHAIGERHRRFTVIGDRLIQEVIRPRFERLAAHFDNGMLLSQEQTGRHHCICTFQHTPRFPATTKLEMGVSRDGNAENVEVYSDVSILPLFFQLSGEDRMAMPLDQVDESQVASWIDKKIMHFLEAYLRLETQDQYQAENAVFCPVCNMQVNKLYAPAQLEHQGKQYFFCVPECKEKFEADPEKYLAGKR
jgi:YHS domain-containing protein